MKQDQPASTTRDVRFAEERHSELVSYVQRHKKATVHELRELFGVSSATIRNDLSFLEKRGLLLRTHGGAMIKTQTRFEENMQERLVHHQREKEAIAAAAVALIEDGDTIILDTGTTVMELARRLGEKRNITVITNDIEIARTVCEYEDATLLLVGGVVRKRFRCAVGSLSQRLLSGLLVDKAFIAANNFDLEKGASTPDIDQSETKKAMIAVASKVILLCDRSKFGTQSFAQFAAPQDFDVIVTDAFESKELRLLDELGVECIAAL